MSNKTNASVNTNESIANNGAVEVTKPTVDQQVEVAAEAKADEVVAEVLKGGKLQSVKASLRRRSWVDIAGAGAIAAAGVVGDMLVTNQLNANLHGDDAEQYSALEIAGVGTATALVASTLRFGLDFIPVVNNNFMGSVLATSLVGNSASVASAYVRDAALSLVKGKLSVNVEELAEEA